MRIGIVLAPALQDVLSLIYFQHMPPEISGPEGQEGVWQ